MEVLKWFGKQALKISNLVLGGVVTMLLWNWFVVLMFNIEPIGLIYGIALGITLSYLTKNHFTQPVRIPKIKDQEVGILVIGIIHDLNVLFWSFLIHMIIVWTA